MKYARYIFNFEEVKYEKKVKGSVWDTYLSENNDLCSCTTVLDHSVGANAEPAYLSVKHICSVQVFFRLSMQIKLEGKQIKGESISAECDTR